MNVFYNTKSNVTVSPDLVVHLFTFIWKKNLSLGFIKLFCTHDFSGVSFAAELSTTIVYNSVFVKYYDFIYIYVYVFKKKQSKFISQF